MDSNRILGAHRLLVNTQLGEEIVDLLPYDAIYRQVGILANPIDPQTGAVLTKNYLSWKDIHFPLDYKNGEIPTEPYKMRKIDFGSLLYIENRREILRRRGSGRTDSVTSYFLATNNL